MKRISCLFGLLALCACDRPQYDLQMVCEDGAKGELLVDAKIYKSHADLTVKRLSKELRDKALSHSRGGMWFADHTWLYNQIPEIDDTIEISVPVNDERDENYKLAGKVEFNLSRDSLTGGRIFTLWHMSDNNLTMNDGEVLPNGMPILGVMCKPVIDAVKDKQPKGFTSEIKNCLNYIDSQFVLAYTESEISYEVYDEKTGRTMYIDKENFIEAFGEMEPRPFYLQNKYTNDPEYVMRACDFAARLRAYIAAHIDAEHIPEPKNVVSVPAGGTITLTVGDEEIVVRGE